MATTTCSRSRPLTCPRYGCACQAARLDRLLHLTRYPTWHDPWAPQRFVVDRLWQDYCHEQRWATLYFRLREYGTNGGLKKVEKSVDNA